jgi:hypothetical protein
MLHLTAFGETGGYWLYLFLVEKLSICMYGSDGKLFLGTKKLTGALLVIDFGCANVIAFSMFVVLTPNIRRSDRFLLFHQVAISATKFLRHM